MKVCNSLTTTCLLLTLFLSTNVEAASISFSDQFTLSGFEVLSASDVGSVVILNEIDLGTIPKFDPALGELTSITITMDGALLVSSSLFAQGIIDITLPHSAEMTMFADVALIVPLGFAQDIATSIRLSGLISCSGAVGGQECENDGIGFDFEFSTSTLLDGGWPVFSGTGMLDELTLQITGGITSVFLDNLDDAENEFDAYVETLVTVNYDFTPVPVPAAFWLLCSAFVGLVTSAWYQRN